jgi:RNA polymerase sigma-70 factor (ECF subfamily)
LEPNADAGDDLRLVEALRRGDEDAFVALVERYQACLLRLAMLYVPSHAIAEEVVQETWIGVLQGTGRFEGRSSFKTWLYRILVHQAQRRGMREHRSVPFSALVADELDAVEHAVDPDRFHPPGHRWPGHWIALPQPWQELPEDQALASETRAQVNAAIAALPPAQREVITLRDVEGWPAEEVCQAMKLTEANQRVLLHRARSKVRRALDPYFGRTEAPP